MTTTSVNLLLWALPQVSPPVADDRTGNLIGDSIGGVLSSSLDEAMKAVWDASTWVLSIAFSVADTFSTFTVDARSGPVGVVWPTLLIVSVAIALGLFFWQLTLAVLRGGRGMMRVATGPVAYGVALAMTVAGIAAALATADGLTTLVLSKGLNVTNFSAAFNHTSVLGQALNGVKAVALGLIGFFGVVPAAIGWVLEIIWRQAAVLVLVATVPITAAGLLAQTTASWFWRGLRWTVAAIAVKPVLALIVVVGVSSVAGASGPVGLLAGVGVLWVSLTAPVALFRLLAFVDPGTDAGQVFRESWSQVSSRLPGGGVSGGPGGSSPGGGSSSGGSGSDSGGMGALEAANTARFDAAGGGQVTPPPPAGTGGASTTGSTDSSNPGAPSGAGVSRSSDSDERTDGDVPGAGSGAGGAVGSDGTAQSVPPATADPPGAAVPDHPTPYPRATSGGSAAGAGGAGGGASGVEEAIETAVILE